MILLDDPSEYCPSLLIELARRFILVCVEGNFGRITATSLICAGNSNLVYTIIRKRNVFHQLANLPADHSSIARALTKRGRGKVANPSTVADHPDQPSMEGSTPATEAEPGTLKVSLAATPGQLGNK